MQSEQNILSQSDDGGYPQAIVNESDSNKHSSTNSNIKDDTEKVDPVKTPCVLTTRPHRKGRSRTLDKSNLSSDSLNNSNETNFKSLSDRASGKEFSENETPTIIYCRVSSRLQRVDGISLIVQEQACREYARNNAWTVVKVVSEVCSAINTAKQTALLQILNSREKTGESIKLLVYNVSRFSRNVSKGLELARKFRQRNIQLVSCIESFDLTTTSGEYTFTTLLNAAEFESRMISRRVKDALAEKKRQGNTLGRAPFGWKAVTSIAEPKQQEIEKSQSLLNDVGSNNNNNTDDNSLKQDLGQVKKRTLVIDQTEQYVIDFIVACRSKGTKLQVVSEILSRVTLVDLTEKPIVLDPPTEQLLEPLGFENIADLLNSYQVFPRVAMGKRGWTAQSISRIYNRQKKKLSVSLNPPQ